MNASIAKQITESAKQPKEVDAALWNQVKVRVYEQIENYAKFGHSQAKINLRTVSFERINKNLDKIKYEMESEGYKVEFLLVRSPDGAREMIVKW